MRPDRVAPLNRRLTDRCRRQFLSRTASTPVCRRPDFRHANTDPLLHRDEPDVEPFSRRAAEPDNIAPPGGGPAGRCRWSARFGGDGETPCADGLLLPVTTEASGNCRQARVGGRPDPAMTTPELPRLCWLRKRRPLHRPPSSWRRTDGGRLRMSAGLTASSPLSYGDARAVRHRRRRPIRPRLASAAPNTRPVACADRRRGGLLGGLGGSPVPRRPRRPGTMSSSPAVAGVLPAV